MTLRALGRAALLLVATTVTCLASPRARAAQSARVLVFVAEGHSALGVRLGAELAALDYEVVPLAPTDAQDGEGIAAALRTSGARAALTVMDRDGVEVCVTDRETLSTSCRRVAEPEEDLAPATIATRAVELLRARLLEAGDRPRPIHARAARPVPPEHRRERPPSPKPRAHRPWMATRVGPGVLFTPGGVRPSVVVAVGADWISFAPISFGVHAAIPFAAPTVTRDEGSATVRTTVVDAGAAWALRRGALRGEAGLGAALAWVQVDGVATAPYAGRSDSLWVPLVTATMSGALAIEERVAVRADVLGGYTLEKASIRFDGTQAAQVGRPLVTAALSLEFAWP